MAREDEIRIIAYRIWEEEGCCDGHDCEHWLKAEVIWEEQNKKAGALIAETEPKQPAKQETKLKPAKKKSQKT